MLHKRNIYKVTANSKKAQQVNPEPFKPAQVPWTYFSVLWNKKCSLIEVFSILKEKPTHMYWQQIDAVLQTKKK